MSGRGRAEAWGLAPAALLLAVAVAVPALRVAQLASSRVTLGEGIEVGAPTLEAFARLWQDGRWWISLRTTTVFTAASVALEMVLGLALALLLHRRFPGRGLARTLVVMPWALPTAVMALAWAWIFNDAFGVANDLLMRAGLLREPLAWLGRPGLALAAMVVADVWKTTPFVTLVLLAGLQGIPSDVLEAAALDGLGPARRLVRVVLPLLVPSLLVALLFRTLQAWGAFDLVYVMTGGGPGGSTETVSLYAFQQYFRYLDVGYGSAVAVQGMAFVAAFAWVVARAARGRGGVA